MGKPYSQELDAFPSTYQWVARQNVKNLQRFLERWGGDHVAVVGSGGSYSAATVVALFREVAHHTVTTAYTPLEFISLLGRLSPRVLLLSAEGKNKDILAAAGAAAGADLATCAITLTTNNPLVDLGRRAGAPRIFPFQMDWIKDGFLATNSLLATVLLFYRVFFRDEAFSQDAAPLIDAQRLLARRAVFAGYSQVLLAKKRPLLVIYSAEAMPFAVDLESKLSEAALGQVQITDLRQFAHGRHLQLASFEDSPSVIVVHSKAERALAEATAALIPGSSQSVCIEVEGTTPQDVAVAGLIDAMLLTEAMSLDSSHDIGQPEVLPFGHAIHALDPWPLIAGHHMEAPLLERAVRRKCSSGKPSPIVLAEMHEAAARYLAKLTTARIKAIIFDFDGTLCRTESRFDPMDSKLVALLSELAREGLKIAIATGRGGSLRDSLVAAFDADIHPLITVGYYSGSLITTLDQPFETPAGSPDFVELLQWLRTTPHAEFCPTMEDGVRLGQLTIRVPSPRHAARLLNTIRSWISTTKRFSWRAYCSGHSVDVLNGASSKRRVAELIAKELGIDPDAEILRIGDCGHEDGNDFELLGEGLSISCDSVSVDLNSCWNFGPKGNNQAETTTSYLRALVRADGAFRLSESALFSHDGASSA